MEPVAGERREAKLLSEMVLNRKGKNMFLFIREKRKQSKDVKAAMALCKEHASESFYLAAGFLSQCSERRGKKHYRELRKKWRLRLSAERGRRGGLLGI